MKITILLFFCLVTLFAGADYSNTQAYQSYQVPKLHHPSFVVYDERKNDLKGLYSPLVGEWKDARVVGDLLVEGKVVCGSCHVSNSTEYRLGEVKELRVGNSFSTLCLSCHDK